MPIPFGISADTAMPLSGIDDSSLDSFSQRDDEDSGLRDYLDLKTGDSGPHRGVVGDIRSPNDLSKTGWGVIFAPSADQQIREALAPLLKHRGIGNAGRDPRLFKSFEGDTGVLRDDSAESWLKRRGVRMDVVRPSLGVPFYLMIVGPPDEISFEFQYALDLYWAVGRIWFPTADEFRQYADSVVHYETMAAADVPTSKQMVVFAPSHDLDPATQAFSRDVRQTDGGGIGRGPARGRGPGLRGAAVYRTRRPEGQPGEDLHGSHRSWSSSAGVQWQPRQGVQPRPARSAGGIAGGYYLQ